MRHSPPDASRTLASRENVLFRLCTVGGRPGGSEGLRWVLLHVVAPDEGEVDSIRVCVVFFLFFFSSLQPSA